MNREMPHNVKIEQELLSQIMQNNELMVEAVEVLEKSDFYSIAHQNIFNTMMVLHKRNDPISAISIITALGQEDVKKIGGITYITEMEGSAATFKSFPFNLRKLKEYGQRRFSIKCTEKFLATCYDETADINQSIGKLNNILTPVESKNNVEAMGSMVPKVIEAIGERHEHGGRLRGMECGIQDLDRALNGFEKKNFDIIAARPSMGKTTMAINIASSIAKNYNVLFFSMEVSKEELIVKLLAGETWINSIPLGNGAVQERDFKKINEAGKRLTKLKLYIDERPGLTYEEIEATALKQKQQTGVDMIIIDYLQYMTLPPGNTRNDQITEVCKRLKTLSKKLDVNITALAQLSRAPEQRPNHRPILSDLRDSGGIEQEAYKITFLYRDEHYNPETEDKGVIECIHAKNRNGKIGTTKLSYIKEFQIIGGIAKEEELGIKK